MFKHIRTAIVPLPNRTSVSLNRSINLAFQGYHFFTSEIHAFNITEKMYPIHVHKTHLLTFVSKSSAAQKKLKDKMSEFQVLPL